MSEEPAEHLMIGIWSRLKLDPHYYGDEDPYFGYVVDEDGPCAVALRTPPHNLLLSRVTNSEAYAAIAEDVATVYGSLPGVFLHAASGTPFLAAWRERTGQIGRLVMSQRSLVATAVTRPDVVGILLRASRDELDLVVEWCEAMEREAMPADTPSVEIRPMIEREMDEPEGGAFLWLVDGEPVSLARTGGTTPSGIHVSSVYTPPRHRNKGFATAVTAAVSAKMLKRYRYCFLNTDAANPASNKIYERIGYRFAGDHAMYRFD
jgi:predicted GNAT family acetyltransferase